MSVLLSPSMRSDNNHYTVFIKYLCVPIPVAAKACSVCNDQSMQTCSYVTCFRLFIGYWSKPEQTTDFQLFDSSPACLPDLLTVYTHSQSQAALLLCRLRYFASLIFKTFGQCSFCYCAPKPQNSLPSDICHMQSSQALKTELKDHLY